MKYTVSYFPEHSTTLLRSTRGPSNDNTLNDNTLNDNTLNDNGRDTPDRRSA